MGRLGIVVAVVVALAAGAGGALLLSDSDEPDRTIAPVAAPTSDAPSTRVAVDDGIPVRDAEAAARRAADHVRGQALSVDLDDGRYEVEVQRPDGAIVEVLLNDRRQVLGVESGEGDSVPGT